MKIFLKSFAKSKNTVYTSFIFVAKCPNKKGEKG
jgi:hypothetical protein